MNKLHIITLQHAAGREKYGFDMMISRLRELGDVWINMLEEEGPSLSALAAPLAEADVLVAGWGCDPVPAQLYDHAPNLQRVVLIGSSVKPLSPHAAWGKDLIITNTADEIGSAAAEYTLGLMLRWLHRFEVFDDAMHEREPWPSSRLHHMQRDLRDMPVGLVGFGAIGRRLTGALIALDAQVRVFDPFVPDSLLAEFGAERCNDLQELMGACDIVSLHAGLTDETRHMIGADELQAMREDALLVNTARGGLIDTDALVSELRRERIHAAIDVFDPEPLPLSHPLRTLPNALLGPHMAGTYNRSLYQRVMDAAVDEVQRLSEGLRAKRVVTPEMFARMT